MSLFTLKFELGSEALSVLRQIAEALDRIAPIPDDPVSLKPEEEVTYVDEDKIAAAELESAVEAEYRKMREELEADGGSGVLTEGHPE